MSLSTFSALPCSGGYVEYGRPSPREPSATTPFRGFSEVRWPGVGRGRVELVVLDDGWISAPRTLEPS